MSEKLETSGNVLPEADTDSVSAGLSQETIDEQNAQLERTPLAAFWYRDRQFGHGVQVGTMTEREKDRNFNRQSPTTTKKEVDPVAWFHCRLRVAVLEAVTPGLH